MKKINMNWTQAKKRFPNLNPFGDKDKDKVLNRFDCKPFNKRLQGKGKYYMLYDKEKEYGLSHGQEETRLNKKVLKNMGKTGVGSYEYDYEE